MNRHALLLSCLRAPASLCFAPLPCFATAPRVSYSLFPLPFFYSSSSPTPDSSSTPSSLFALPLLSFLQPNAPHTPPPTLTPYLFPAAPSTSSPPSFYYLLSLGALPSSPSTKLPSPTSPPQPNAHSFNQTLPPYPLLYLLCLNQVAPLPLGLSESSASIGFPA